MATLEKGPHRFTALESVKIDLTAGPIALAIARESRDTYRPNPARPG